MAIPKASEFNRAVLEIAAERGEVLTIRQLGEAIPLRLLSLTDEDFQERYPNSGQPIVRNLITFAAGKLKRSGFLDSPERGKFRINQLGRDYLNSTPDEISGASLEKIAARLRETSYSDDSEALEDPDLITGPTIPDDDEEISESDLPPIEAIARAHAGLQINLVDDILDSLKSVSPSRFEQIVVNLLEKIGYGNGKWVGGPGDGGIDGIIERDPLGFEKIGIQAKRYDTQKVGEPEIRDFNTALDLIGAPTGVVVTTSTFNNAAKQAAKTVSASDDKFIRLIDGQELARLMIRHNVGVVTEKTYEVKKLDENFFSDPDNI